mgnify:CR=1 FL=1
MPLNLNFKIFSFMKRKKPLSKNWVIISFIIFIVVEIIIGSFIGQFVAGTFVSYNLRHLLQGLFNLAGYLVGGFLIGVISPGIRVLESAIGAFLSVVFMLGLSILSPFTFIHFSLTKVLLGGGIAFYLAMSGAKFGEKMSGSQKNKF